MTLRTRRILFFIFLAVFIPSSAGIISYSQGWRFNFETFAIQKTGAIYIETQPKDVLIKIDQKFFTDKSGIIQKGTLITDLLPKNYQIKIQRDGYFLYHKNITVKPSLVTEAVGIILIPMDFKNELKISKNLKGEKFIDFSADASKIIIKNSKNNIYYLYNLNNQSSLNISNLFENMTGKNIKKIAFYPLGLNKLIIESDVSSAIYIVDVNRLKSEIIFKNSKESSLISWNAENSNIYYIEQNIGLKTKNYQLIAFNLIAKTKSKIADLPSDNNPYTAVKSSANERFLAALNTLGNIYLFDSREGIFKQIAHDAKFFAFSPDGKKIAFLDNDGKLNIYFLEEWTRNIFKKSGETIGFNLENKELIKSFYWYEDSAHLFIQQKSVDFMEIDERLPLNRYPIVKEIEDFYHNWKSGFTYYLKDAKLYFSSQSINQ